MIKSLWTLVDYVVNRTPFITPMIAPGQEPLKVIWSNQNSSRVEKPYVVLNYTSVNVPDHEYVGKVDENGNRVQSSWRKATVDLQFFAGPDSYSVASRFVNRLALEDSVNKQVELDCAIGTRLMLARVPFLLNESQYEDRAIYTFEFYYTESEIEFVSMIETVVAEGELIGSASTSLPLTIIASIHENPPVTGE